MDELRSELRPEPRTEPDYKFKILLIGDAAVGKTSIIVRYAAGSFGANYIMTIGKILCWAYFELVIVSCSTQVVLQNCSVYRRRRPLGCRIISETRT